MPSGAAVRPAAGRRPGSRPPARQRTGAVLPRLVMLLVVAALAVLAPTMASATTTAPATPDPSASTPAASAESIRVLVRNAGDPVEGVDFTVKQGDTEIGTGTTDAQGQGVVGVPGPGDYQVSVDPESLPEGDNLKNPDLTEATVTVNPAQTKPYAFQVITGDAPAEQPAQTSSGIGLDDVPQLVASGLRFGLILALAAIGLSVIFGTTGLTNFAHGELMTFGAVITYIFNVVAGFPFLLAAVIGVALGGVFGLLNDRLLWQPLRRRGTGLVAMMIISIGLALVIRYVIGLDRVFGTRTLFYNEFQGQRGIDFGLFLLRPIDLISMGLAIVTLIAVSLALLKTRIGKATRAVADNPALAAASGIDVDRVIRVVWVVGGALAALSGILLGLGQGLNYFLGFQILLLVFAAVTLGGLGTAFGALIGSIIVGLFVELSTLVLAPSLKNVGALVVLILVLLLRPQGILGRRERIG